MRAALTLLLAVLATAAPARIHESALHRHIAVLAGDAMQGRKPGTAGGIAAERYITGRFAAAGLTPAAAGHGWRQPVPLPGGVTADNVIGRIAGTGQGGQAILFMAHWDHLGLCRPAGARDRICNGAVDNASGVAVLIEIARAMAHGPRLRRDILFVATTGEEMGLLGAKAFVAAPPLPLDRIVAAFNLDTVALAPRGAPVVTVGRGMTPLDPVIDATARALGRVVDTTDAADAYVQRQDGWVLMQAGVPAVMVGSAYGRPLAPFLAGRYHHPDDEVAGIRLGGAAQDADLLVAIARNLADAADVPGLDRAKQNH